MTDLFLKFSAVSKRIEEDTEANDAFANTEVSIKVSLYLSYHLLNYRNDSSCSLLALFRKIE